MSTDLTDKMRDRILEIATSAEEAFWDQVARMAAYPPLEVETGDFPPEASRRFTQECERTVEEWVIWNMQVTDGVRK